MPTSSPLIQDKLMPSVQTCSYTSFVGYELALFLGLLTVQFLIAFSMQKRRGMAWSILSCEWHQCLPEWTEGEKWEGLGTRLVMNSMMVNKNEHAHLNYVIVISLRSFYTLVSGVATSLYSAHMSNILRCCLGNSLYTKHGINCIKSLLT